VATSFLLSIYDLISVGLFDFHLVLSESDELRSQDADRLGRNASFDLEIVSGIVHYKVKYLT